MPCNDDENDDSNNWFFCPNHTDATTEAGIFQQMWQDNDNLSHAAGIEMEVVGEREEFPPENEGNNMSGNFADQYPELALHLHNVSDPDMISESQESLNMEANQESSSGDNSNTKVKLTLKVNGVGEVHKSIAFCLLNSSPEGLSTDWLKRVKSRVNNYGKQSEALEPDELCLFDDVAFHIKGKPPKFKIGRVVRMRNKVRGTVEFKTPASLCKPDQFPKLQLLTNLYDEASGHYIYDSHSNREFSLSDVIMKVKLTLEGDNKFVLDHKDRETLNEFIKNVSNKKKREPPGCQQGSQQNKSIASENGDSRVVLLVRNQDVQNGTGTRRSERTRKAVFFEAE